MTPAITDSKLPIAPTDAHGLARTNTDTALKGHAKNIETFMQGEVRGMAQFFGYRFLIGCELIAAKQTIAHGNSNNGDGLMKWAEKTFPNVPYRTLTSRVEFATCVLDKSKGLPLFRQRPLQLSATTNLTPEQQDAILKMVPEVMEGKGMVEFMQDMKLLKEPELAGGLRATAEQLEKPRKATAAEIAAAADEITRDRAGWLREWAADKKNLALARTKTLHAMEAARAQLGKAIETILKQRKVTK